MATLPLRYRASGIINKTKIINVLTGKINGWLQHNKKKFEEIANKNDETPFKKIIEVNLKLKVLCHCIYIEIIIKWNQNTPSDDLLVYIKNELKSLHSFHRSVHQLEVAPHNIYYSLTNSL